MQNRNKAVHFKRVAGLHFSKEWTSGFLRQTPQKNQLGHSEMQNRNKAIGWDRFPQGG
jgi:hypothetical protein